MNREYLDGLLEQILNQYQKDGYKQDKIALFSRLSQQTN